MDTINRNIDSLNIVLNPSDSSLLLFNRLISFLPDSQNSLVHLSLTNSHLNDQQMDLLCTSLAESKVIKLNLCNSVLSDSGITSLCHVLPQFEVIDFSAKKH